MFIAFYNQPPPHGHPLPLPTLSAANHPAYSLPSLGAGAPGPPQPQPAQQQQQQQREPPIPQPTGQHPGIQSSPQMTSSAATGGMGGMHTQASPSLTSQVPQITGIITGQGPPPPQQSQSATATQTQPPPGVTGGNQNGPAQLIAGAAAGPPPPTGAQGPPGSGPGGPILNVGHHYVLRSR